MRRLLRFVDSLVLAIMLSALLHGQTSIAPRVPAPGTHPAITPKVTQPHQVPCWQEAGISKAAMQQRKQIQQNARSQVEAVCADSSLTMQQRQQRIRQIHPQAKQESEALITPAQQEAMKSCQQSRATGASHPSIPHPGHGGTGPCGEMPSANQPPPTQPAQPGEEPQ